MYEYRCDERLKAKTDRSIRHKAGTTKETIVLDRLWNKRPDGFTIQRPTETKEGELVILEFKHMSCVTDQYVRRARNVAETQYAPIKSDLLQTLGLQGWTVSQENFITGARSLNEKDLHDNLAYFKDYTFIRKPR